MTVVSLPRDAEVAISGHEEYFPSKLNSAYEYGGSATAVKTVQKISQRPDRFLCNDQYGRFGETDQCRWGR